MHSHTATVMFFADARETVAGKKKIPNYCTKVALIGDFFRLRALALALEQISSRNLGTFNRAGF